MRITETRGLPVLSWDGFRWTCELTLPAWKGYLGRREDKPATSVTVQLAPPQAPGQESPTPPAEEQAAAFLFLERHAAKCAQSVLAVIAKQYGERQKRGWQDRDGKTLSPLKSVGELTEHIELQTIEILNVAKKEQAYIGFGFSCSWDQEHGLGVMTHNASVVAAGGEDHSFLEWLAERDGGKPLAGEPSSGAVLPPAGRKAAPQQPVAKKPGATKPAPKKPAAKKPEPKKPAAKKPEPKKPAAKKPAAKKPAAKKPAPQKATRT